MTNPILEFLRANTRKYLENENELCEPIKELVRDYAMMRDALSDANYVLNNVMLNTDGSKYVLPLRSVNRLQERTNQVLFATAETHRELLQAVREGM